MKLKRQVRDLTEQSFNHLVESALDFLQTGLEEVDKRPKYSIIHFFNGIELLLKARLLHEHWALVVARPGEVSRKNFSDGDFESVSLKQSLERIEKVCDENLKEERGCFVELSAHRNRAVHFYHAAHTAQANQKILEEIVSQQLRAGALLMRLLRQKWGEIFVEHDASIRKIERALHEHKQFLKAKFEVVKPQLAAIQKEGGTIEKCYWCEMAAAEVINDDPPLISTKCHVCSHSHSWIRIECPECHDADIDLDSGTGTCPGCDNSVDLDTLLTEYADGYGVAYCPECSRYDQESIVSHGNSYLCLSCGTTFNKVSDCEWCSTRVGGELEDSYLMGCMMCEGMAGHDKDD